MRQDDSLRPYTGVPNAIMNALIANRISGEESQCLWLILRKTFGWHKKEDWIANSQFVAATGIKKQNVNRALHKLIEKNIVIKNDYQGRPIYSLEKDASKWIRSSKKITKTVVSNDSLSNQKRLKVVINNDGHKRNFTKETITKENLDHQAKSAIKDLNEYI